MRAAGRIQFGRVYHKKRSFAMDFTGLLFFGDKSECVFYVPTFLRITRSFNPKLSRPYGVDPTVQ